MVFEGHREWDVDQMGPDTLDQMGKEQQGTCPGRNKESVHSNINV